MLLYAYNVLGYYVSFCLFGVVGLGLNLCCLILGWLPATRRTERIFQHLIQRHFALFVGWLTLARLCRIRYRGLERLSSERGCVIAANHPGLLDITYLLARLPEAVCIFKPTIRRNPVLGAAARRAGYLANDGGIDLVREAADKVAAGQMLLVFPEGSRTPPGEALRALKPGFVLIARRARAPIQLVRITCDAPLLVKGRSGWKVPPLPANITIEAGPRLVVDETTSTPALITATEAWFRAGVVPPRREGCVADELALPLVEVL